MSSVEPWGDLAKASILVIGHDPRLQKSGAQAKNAFFFELLGHELPTYGPDLAKYGLAKAVLDYVCWLAGCDIPIGQLYVTNLCNEFLDHKPGSGTVLIPDDRATTGIANIAEAIGNGHFQVILPMSQQVFYHLCRSRFIDEDSDLVKQFVIASNPRENKAKQQLYVASKGAAFLKVCGIRFHHEGVPVVPIVHVRLLNSGKGLGKYEPPTENAKKEIRGALRSETTR